jgi:hypothetical protein
LAHDFFRAQIDNAQAAILVQDIQEIAVPPNDVRFDDFACRHDAIITTRRGIFRGPCQEIRPASATL